MPILKTRYKFPQKHSESDMAVLKLKQSNFENNIQVVLQKCTESGMAALGLKHPIFKTKETSCAAKAHRVRHGNLGIKVEQF